MQAIEVIDQYFAMIDTEVAVSAAQALPELRRIEPSVFDRATECTLRMMFSCTFTARTRIPCGVYHFLGTFSRGATPPLWYHKKAGGPVQRG
jgi:hypothetical protein